MTRGSDPRIRPAEPTLQKPPAFCSKASLVQIPNLDNAPMVFIQTFKRSNTDKSIYACPHPSIPTTIRSHVIAGYKIKILIYLQVSTHGTNLRVEPVERVRNGLAGCGDQTRDMTRFSRVNRNLASRVGLGLEMFKTSRVGSGRVGSGRVRTFTNARGSGRVRSSHLKKITGWVASDPT